LKEGVFIPAQECLYSNKNACDKFHTASQKWKLFVSERVSAVRHQKQRRINIMDNNKRSIEAVIAPPAPHMVGDGFRVHGFFPGRIIDKKRMSPFFLLDYNSKVEFTPSDKPRGVSVHPHRGFETVTIAYHGKVAHHDSAGNSGVINPGYPDEAPIKVGTLDSSKWTLHLEADSKDERGNPVKVIVDGKLENIGSPNRTLTGTWARGNIKGNFKLARE